MRSFVFSDVLNVLNNSRYIMYCYMGERRGSLAFYYNSQIVIISPNGYIESYDSSYMDKSSNFELWAFIHEMIEYEYFYVRQEAMNRLFDVYSNLYNFIPILQSFDFIIE